jgi:hypothetical protein
MTDAGLNSDSAALIAEAIQHRLAQIEEAA